MWRPERSEGATHMPRGFQFYVDAELQCLTSLVPRPRPPGEGKGLVTIARFLVCAESAVLFSRQPIRLLGLKISCDIKRP